MKKKKIEMKSFSLFFKAMENTKHEMWVSVQLLVIITIVLSIILYVVEHIAQPEVYHSWWDSVLWSFMQYIGDPGNFADYKPITIAGRIIAAIIGIIGIAIFAVPAGLIGSGFMDAVAEERKEREMEEACVAIHKRFRRSAQGNSWYYNEKKLKKCYKCVDRIRKLTFLQIKLGMSVDRLMETIAYCPDLRLANLASTRRRIDNPQDCLVVVNYPLNNEYGCCLDRGSNVTIVAPSALNEIGTGNDAFSLAAMGGFNYVSRELTPNSEDPFSFYIMDKEDLELMYDYDKKEDVESQALHFMYDLTQFKKRSEERGEKHWFIFILGTLKTEKCQVHFWRLASDPKEKISYRIDGPKRKYGSTILLEDEEKLQNMFHDIQESLCNRSIIVQEEEQGIVTDIDNCDIWKAVTDHNIMRRMGGGIDCNALTIRMGYEILYYCTSHLLIMKDIADAIKKQIEPDREIPEEAKRCYLEDGDGFADKYGEEKVFLRSPQALKEMIRKGNEYAREKFEHLDLDGNEQAGYDEHHKPSWWKRIWK